MSQQAREALIIEMMEAFQRSVEIDIMDMTRNQESGWQYDRSVQICMNGE